MQRGRERIPAACRRRPLETEHRAGERRGAAEKPFRLAHDRTGEQLARDPKREAGLELPGARAHHAHPGVRRQRPHGRQQRRLPDPRRRLDHEHAPVSCNGCFEKSRRRRQLPLAFEQPGPPPHAHWPSLRPDFVAEAEKCRVAPCR